MGTLVFITGTNCSQPGRFSGGVRTLPGWTGTVKVQVRCWYSSLAVYPSFEAAIAGLNNGDYGLLLGFSDPFLITLTAPPDFPPSLPSSGLTPIIMYPAPLGGPSSLSGPSAIVLGTNAADGTRTVRLAVDVQTGYYPNTKAWFQFGPAVPYAGTNGPITVQGIMLDSANIFTDTTNLAVNLPFSPGHTYHWNAVMIRTGPWGPTTTTNILADQTFTLPPDLPRLSMAMTTNPPPGVLLPPGVARPRISWPRTATDFRLEASGTLNTNDWTPLLAPAWRFDTNETEISYYDDIWGLRFYRLSQP